MEETPKGKAISSKKRKRSDDEAAAEEEEEAASQLTSVEERMKVVGSMIEIWWPDAEKFYKATIESYNPDKDLHTVVYVDDGDVETLNLNQERWKKNKFDVNGKKGKENNNNDLDPEDRGGQEKETSSMESSSKAAQMGKKGLSSSTKSKSKDVSSKAATATETESSERTQTPTGEVVRYVHVAKFLNLRVKSFNNIDDVKNKFSEFEGIETDLLKVFFSEGYFENDRSLDCLEKDGSTVHMNLHFGVRMQVHIKLSSWTTTDKLISLDVHGWETIRDVKTKFKYTIKGTPANPLTLIFGGEQLDDFRTLASYDIVNDSVLHAVFLGEDEIKISVSYQNRGPIEVKVRLCSTVKVLKTMIQCMGVLEAYKQKLTFNGVVLENNRKLGDCNIQMGSVLHLDSLI